MNKINISVSIFSVALFAVVFAMQSMASENPHWEYYGDNGPDAWGRLDQSYIMCAEGKNQSPINLTNMIEGSLPDLKLKYSKSGTEVVNNGYTIQVNFAPGNTMTVEGRTFELKQVHFHSLSENNIEGKSYPLEGHFVHADKAGNLAVIAILYDHGEHNNELEKAWEYMSASSGDKHMLPNKINASKLFPEKHAYYRFNGSLTTPPCSEGVRWFVMKDINNASQRQVRKFISVIPHDNNRPLQAINAREVIQ